VKENKLSEGKRGSWVERTARQAKNTTGPDQNGKYRGCLYIEDQGNGVQNGEGVGTGKNK